MKKIILVIILFFIVSCGKNEIALSSKDVYNQGIKLLNDKKYYLAAEKFESIETNFIIDEYVNKSLILSAYSYYMASKYSDSMRIIELFKERNIIDENMDYMDYLYILNLYKLSVSSFKSIEKAEFAYEKSEEFLTKYDNNKYIDDIKERLGIISDRLATNQLNIAIYNIDINNILGALNHINIVENKYKTNSAILAKCYYLKIKIFEYLKLDEQVLLYQNKLSNLK